WITGEGRRAVSVRRRLGPSSPNAGVAWAVFAAVLLLVIWALPLHRFLIAAILVVLACTGFELARRQPVREYEAEGPAPPGEAPALPWRTPAQATAPTQVEELERLPQPRPRGAPPADT